MATLIKEFERVTSQEKGVKASDLFVTISYFQNGKKITSNKKITDFEYRPGVNKNQQKINSLDLFQKAFKEKKLYFISDERPIQIVEYKLDGNYTINGEKEPAVDHKLFDYSPFKTYTSTQILAKQSENTQRLDYQARVSAEILDGMERTLKVVKC